MILIVLKAQVRPEKREEWVAGIERYTADVRTEPGNVSFDYYENSQRPDEFVVVEVFTDAAAGSAHVATAHAQQFFGDMGHWVTARPLINYQDLPGDAWTEMGEVTPE